MRRSGILLVLVGLVVASAVAGCRQEEQGRILGYQKGTYLGPSQARLSEGTRDELRQRVQRQGGARSFTSFAGGGGAPGADVRPPTAMGGALSDQARDAVRSRVLKQGSN
jgi:hypothetical protein